MPYFVRIATNPANPDSWYKLQGNGIIVPAGPEPPPPVPQDSMFESHSSGNAPIAPASYGDYSAVIAIQVTDWDTPSGYVFTTWGFVYAFGDAVEPAAGTQLSDSSYPYNGYTDFVMDPAANGKGYGLGEVCDVYPIGGEVAVPFTVVDTRSVRLLMDYPTKKYAVLDQIGRRFSRNGAVALPASIYGQAFSPSRPTATGPIVSAFHIYDGLDAGEGHGWTLNSFGFMHELNGAQPMFGQPIREGWTLQADFSILDDGTGADPLEIVTMDYFGSTARVIVSTAPTVTVLGPETPTTDTSRPSVIWAMQDAEGDAALGYRIRVFTAAQYGAGGFNPETSPAFWESEASGPMARNVRSVQIDTDVPNGTYRAYVWVTDTSNLESAPDFVQWVQNVVAPATPTLTVTPGPILEGTLLEVDTASTAAGAVFVVEYHDDGIDAWQYVTDADALEPVANHAEVIDREAVPEVERTYRARQVVVDPYLVGGYSAEHSATITADTEVLIDLFSDLAMAVNYRADEFSFDREVVAGVEHPPGRKRAVIVSGEHPVKGVSSTLKLRTLNAGDYAELDAVIDTGSVLLFRDPYRRAWYVRVTDTVTYSHIDSAPEPGETTVQRHHHEVDIPVTEQDRPLAGPLEGPLALTDTGE